MLLFKNVIHTRGKGKHIQECVRTEIALCSVFVHEMSRRGRDWNITAHPEPQAIFKQKAQDFWREFPPDYKTGTTLKTAC